MGDQATSLPQTMKKTDSKKLLNCYCWVTYWFRMLALSSRGHKRRWTRAGERSAASEPLATPIWRCLHYYWSLQILNWFPCCSSKHCVLPETVHCPSAFPLSSCRAFPGLLLPRELQAHLRSYSWPRTWQDLSTYTFLHFYRAEWHRDVQRFHSALPKDPRRKCSDTGRERCSRRFLRACRVRVFRSSSGLKESERGDGWKIITIAVH